MITLKNVLRVKPIFFLLLLIGGQLYGQSDEGSTSTTFLSTEESLRSRKTPEWFSNAKFGIFIHWGLYSVPGWATPIGTPDKVTDWGHFYKNNPYAEWYLNSLRIQNSPTQKFHQDKYGSNFDYYQFSKEFNKKTKRWKAEEWVELFKSAGAKYIVLTTKHHDGFTLFPSNVRHPLTTNGSVNSPRDLVKDLETTSKKAGLKFGVYYSGGLDWSFTQSPIKNVWPDLMENFSKSAAYASYVDMHYYELIRRYKPDILWNDVTYPPNGDILGIFAELFNSNPDAVVNNRWNRYNKLTDFETPEYVVFDSISKRKWESCRGIGFSFGYNQLEDEKHYLSANGLIDMLIDIVSKNGNLLLNVGPRADGSIPEFQRERLLAIGDWLKINGEAIFDTRPWIKAGEFSDSVRICYTRKNNALYVFLLDKPRQKKVAIPVDVNIAKESQITLLGFNGSLSWKREDKHIIVDFPDQMEQQHAFVFKVLLED